MVEQIRRQREEIAELMKLAEKVVGDLEDAGGRLGNEGEGLAARGREAEVVMGGV